MLSKLFGKDVGAGLVEKDRPRIHSLQKFRVAVSALREGIPVVWARIWPWAKSIRDKTCCVQAGDRTVVWPMSSDDVRHTLTIQGNR